MPRVRKRSSCCGDAREPPRGTLGQHFPEPLSDIDILIAVNYMNLMTEQAKQIFSSFFEEQIKNREKMMKQKINDIESRHAKRVDEFAWQGYGYG